MTSYNLNRECSNEDEDSIEGAITRSLFCTEDDSSDDEPLIAQHEINEQKVDTTTTKAMSETESTNKFIQYPIMDVVLEEQIVGGSIAQRLWPAAEYLARYIMENYAGRLDGSEGRESQPMTILELGAGVGLTGLQLATHFNCRVLLTDLSEAIPLLERNIDLNRERFRLGEDAVHAQVLAWGEVHHGNLALDWIGNDPFLIIASDCVYFKELHTPLEETLCQLLTNAPAGSKCLIAGMRRWKRDNHFYVHLGQRTRTMTHQLVCNCLHETVSRDDNGREIVRVFCVEWKERPLKTKRDKHEHGTEKSS